MPQLRFFLLVAARVVQRGHRLQRKFRVDAERALVGQEHHASGRLPVESVNWNS